MGYRAGKCNASGDKSLAPRVPYLFIKRLMGNAKYLINALASNRINTMFPNLLDSFRPISASLANLNGKQRTEHDPHDSPDMLVSSHILA